MKILAFMSLFASWSTALVTIDLTSFPDKVYDETVTLNVGDSFEVMLRENPTTGYIWQVLDDDLTSEGLINAIKVESANYVQDQNRRGAVGVGGIRTFQFKVIGASQGNLNLYHGRTWEMKSLSDKGISLKSYIQKVIPIVSQDI